MGDGVRVTADWSEFRGRRGVVSGEGRDDAGPFLMVLLDSETAPLRFGLQSLALEEAE
jgi:hypothetical protein